MSQSSHNEVPITFNPVVSVFCWLLGSSIKESQLESSSMIERVIEEKRCLDTKISEENRKSGTLSWRDAKGGNISEYITVVQDRITSDFTSADDMAPQLARKNVATESMDEDMRTPSPCWGFYIPITPPMQELFRRDGLISLDSDNAQN